MTGSRLALALCCAAMPFGLAACGDDEGDGTTTKTFKVTERDTDDFGYVDAPPKTTIGQDGPEKMSPGDQLSFRSDLIRGGKDVGDLLGTCTVISGTTFDNAGMNCSATYELPEGKLALSVGGMQALSKGRTVGIVTGGSGAYAGATGTFESPESDGDSVSTFTLRLPEKD